MPNRTFRPLASHSSAKAASTTQCAPAHKVSRPRSQNGHRASCAVVTRRTTVRRTAASSAAASDYKGPSTCGPTTAPVLHDPAPYQTVPPFRAVSPRRAAPTRPSRWSSRTRFADDQRFHHQPNASSLRCSSTRPDVAEFLPAAGTSTPVTYQRRRQDHPRLRPATRFLATLPPHRTTAAPPPVAQDTTATRQPPDAATQRTRQQPRLRRHTDRQSAPPARPRQPRRATKPPNEPTPTRPSRPRPPDGAT